MHIPLRGGIVTPLHMIINLTLIYIIGQVVKVDSLNPTMMDSNLSIQSHCRGWFHHYEFGRKIYRVGAFVLVVTPVLVEGTVASCGTKRAMGAGYE